MGKTGLQTRQTRARIVAAIVVACWLFAVLCGAVDPAAAVSELDYGLEQHSLHRIVISGNTAFTDKELKGLLKIREPRRFHPLMLVGLSDRTARYQPHLLDAELRILQRHYRKHGYHQAVAVLDSVTTDREGRGDVVHISMFEGLRTDVAGVEFLGADALDLTRAVQSLEYVAGVPAPSDLNDLGGDIYHLRTQLWELGHIRARIDPRMRTVPSETPDRNAAVISYRIEPGPAFTVRDIRLEGQERSRPELITRELAVTSGELFRWSDVERSQVRLLDTSLFRDVSFLPVNIDTLAGTTDLLVQVVERKPAYYEFGFGVGTRERIRLLGAWGHNNLFGRGHRLRLRARVSLNYEDAHRLSDGRADPEPNYRYDAGYTVPRFFGRFDLAPGLYLAKETRGESGLNLLTQGFFVGTSFAGGRRTSNTLDLRVEVVDPELHPDAIASLRDAFEASDLRKTSTRSLGWGLYEEKRDDPLRPSAGSLRTVQFELAGGPLGGDNSFVKASAAWHGYWRPFFGGVIATRISAGVVRPYAGSTSRGADGVPYQERFFAGGVSTVRGYQERSLGPQITDPAVRDSLQLANDVPLSDQPARGGNYLILSNVEWRFPMPLLKSWRVSGVVFVDGGNVWERARDIQLRSFRWRSYPREPDDPSATTLWDYRWSFGGGVRVDTPVGPVRMDVGLPLKRALQTDPEHEGAVIIEDGVIYHFSLGFPF
jgi:outer membrane protein insertion porin family